MLLILFAFFSGLITILAPCIWPLLPIILSSSIAGQSKSRPAGIVLGIMLSFSIFTLAISSLVRVFHFDPNNLRIVAVVIIGFLGLVMLIPALLKRLELLVSRLSGVFAQTVTSKHNDFLAGFITGLSLGIVWAPCAGPILATIAALAATGQVTIFVVALTLAYAAGVGLPLFFLAYGGQQLLKRSRIVSPYTARIQQVFGAIMILAAIAIYTNYDKVLEVKLLDLFPSYTQLTAKLDNNTNIKKQLINLNTKQKTVATNAADTTGLFNVNSPAPELVGINHWLNTPQPLTISALRGKVVLVDFWTYTCINCIRTLPHVTAWYDKYKDQGLVVIGVHTPEFEFEKNTDNVQKAIAQYHIHYPVAQDNDFATWQNFSNQYWPAEYLIDATGRVRRTHFGEGEYDDTEKAIQTLLAENGSNVTSSLTNMSDATPDDVGSPETYVGAKRAEYYYPTQNVETGTRMYSLTENLPLNSFSLGGEWNITAENAVAGKNAVLNYHFKAGKVFLVLRPGARQPGLVKVYLDGKIVGDAQAGSDVKNGSLTVDTDRLYNLIDLKNAPGEHVLKLEFVTPGVEAFAFTFG